MVLQKQKIDINFLKSIDESVSECINQTLSKAVNVVATRFGHLSKRWGYQDLGDNNVNFRTLARHDKELIALADEGVYKYAGGKFRSISTSVCTEVTSEPIFRNVYNQSNPKSLLIGDDLITIYEDSRGGYRYTVKNILNNSFIVRDSVLGSSISKIQLYKKGNKVYIFYKKSDNTLAYKQFERTNYLLLDEVVVEDVTIGDCFSVQDYNDLFCCIGYLQGNDFKIGYYKILDGTEGDFSDACPIKATYLTDATNFVFFKADYSSSNQNPTFYFVYTDTSSKIVFTSIKADSTVIDTEDVYYFDNMHSITVSFLDDRIDIWYDKEATQAQEYLLIYTTLSYTGTVTTPVIKGVGLALASEAFVIGGKSYCCCSYASVFQPSFYIIASDGTIAGKFNKDSGMPHKSSAVLSNVIYSGEEILFPMETRTRLDKEGDFYSQNYGINLYKLAYGYEIVTTKEVEQYLFLSGSIVRQYDGASLNEAGFLIRPDESMITLTQMTSKNVGSLTSGLGAIRVTSEGVGGDATINLITGGTYNAEVVSVVGTVIDVQIQDGVSTARSIVTAIQASVPAEALVDVDVITDGKMNIGASVTISGGDTGDLADGVYQYQVVYSWTDNFGNIHRSAPNIALSVATLANDIVQLKIPSLLLTEKEEIWIEIYRTEVDGNVFHLAGYCLNDSSQVYTYYLDSLDDTELITNEVLYTAGGVLENDSYPVSSCLAVLDNRLLLANQDSGFVFYTKELKEGLGLSASDFLSINTGTKGGRIVALKSFKDVCVVFKERSIGIITGQFANDLGVEISLKYDVVSEEYGCVSKSAIAEFDAGIIYQSYQGVCLLDQTLKSTYIGGPVEDKKDFILKACSVLSDIQTIVFLGDEAAYTFNYGRNIWTEFSGHNGYSSVSIDGDFYYLDLFGRIQKKDDTAYADGKTRQPIKTIIGTPWIQLGNINGFERFYKLYFGGKIKEPTTFKVSIYYDFNEVPTDVFVYSPDPKRVFGELEGQFFQITNTTIFESICVYPTIQKCTSFRVEIEEIFPNNVPTAGITYYGISIEAGGKKGWFKQYNKHTVTT